MRFQRVAFWLWGLGLATASVLIFVLAFRSPLAALLREAHAAESQRLREAFQPTLLRALAHEDDLARIDELKRLQSLPGVLFANLTADQRLILNVAQTPWQRYRYRFLERLWSVSLGLGVLGVVLGARVQRQQQHLFTRVKRGRARARSRYQRARVHTYIEQVEIWLPRVQQAMSLALPGLVLLDRHQSIVAFNALAGTFFQLSPQATGSHWLDLYDQPLWAHALRRSLGQPGEQIPVPLPQRPEPVFLLSFPALGSTWILV